MVLTKEILTELEKISQTFQEVDSNFELYHLVGILYYSNGLYSIDIRVFNLHHSLTNPSRISLKHFAANMSLLYPKSLYLRPRIQAKER